MTAVGMGNLQRLGWSLKGQLSKARVGAAAWARWGRFRILSSGRKLQKAKHLAKALTESGGENGTRRVQGTLRYQVYARLGGQLSLRKDIVEGSFRCVWHSTSLSSLTMLSHATAPSAPFPPASSGLCEKQGPGPSACGVAERPHLVLELPRMTDLPGST